QTCRYAGADGRATQGGGHLGVLFRSLYPSSCEPQHAGNHGGRCRPSIVRLPGQGQVDLFRRCFFQRRAPASQKSEGRVWCCARARPETGTARALRAVEPPNGRRRKCTAVADCATLNDQPPLPQQAAAQPLSTKLTFALNLWDLINRSKDVLRDGSASSAMLRCVAVIDLR